MPNILSGENIEPGQRVTNGEAHYCSTRKRNVWRFTATVIALDRGEAWVYVHSGLNQGHHLTFSIEDLFNVTNLPYPPVPA